MSSVATHIESLKKTLPPHVTLVAVSKTHPVETLMEAYRAGQRVFGENKVQELIIKHEAMPNDVEWHYIGHLQTNKIKFIVPFVSLIHGIDSIKLLLAVNKEAKKANRNIQCLLQVHIAVEETKFGFSPLELIEVLKDDNLLNLGNVTICGLMGMATFTDNQNQINAEFGVLKSLFDTLKTTTFKNNPSFKTLSMGMSDDYLLAINNGSNMIRVGSSIFGHRNYTANS